MLNVNYVMPVSYTHLDVYKRQLAQYTPITFPRITWSVYDTCPSQPQANSIYTYAFHFKYKYIVYTRETPIYMNTASAPIRIWSLSYCLSLSLLYTHARALTHKRTCSGTISAIYQSLCTATIAPRLSWSVSPGFHGNDHFPLLITTSAPRKEVGLQRWWCTDRDNWTAFLKDLRLATWFRTCLLYTSRCV